MHSRKSLTTGHGRASTRMLRSVSANLEADWITCAAIGLLLLVIALGACALPALRVAGVNPADALRHE